MIDPLQKYDITHQHYLWPMEPEHHPVKKESSSTIVYIYILYIYIFIYRTSIFGFQQLVDLGNQMILNLHPISRNQGPWYQPKLLFGKPINTNMSYMAKGHPEVGWAPIVFAVRPSQHCILWSLYRVIYKFALVDPHLIWV